MTQKSDMYYENVIRAVNSTTLRGKDVGLTGQQKRRSKPIQNKRAGKKSKGINKL